MPSLIAEQRLGWVALAYSILYLIKELRRKNIETITFGLSLDYLSNVINSRQICRLGEIVYVKTEITVGRINFKRSQKWKIVGYEPAYKSDNIEIDFENCVYEIEPVYAEGVIAQPIQNPKKKITDFSNFKFDERTLGIIEFRKKYENFLIYSVIMLCFLNCLEYLTSKDSKHRFMSYLLYYPDAWQSLVLKAIKETQHLFNYLDLPESTATRPPSIWQNFYSKISMTAADKFGTGLKDIIANTHKIIFKEVFRVETNVFDSLFNQTFASNFSKKVAQVAGLLSKSGIKFSTNTNDYFNKPVNFGNEAVPVYETVLKYFKTKLNHLRPPSFPTNIVFNFKTEGGGKMTGGGLPVNMFNLACNLIGISDPDTMLTIINRDFNAFAHNIDFKNDGPSQILSGLSVEEREEIGSFEKIKQTPIGVGSGGGRKKYNKKIYKGGLFLLDDLAGAAVGTICYIAAGTSLPAGVVATGSGLSYFGGMAVTQVMVVPVAAQISSVATLAWSLGVTAASFGLALLTKRQTPPTPVKTLEQETQALKQLVENPGQELQQQQLEKERQEELQNELRRQIAKQSQELQQKQQELEQQKQQQRQEELQNELRRQIAKQSQELQQKQQQLEQQKQEQLEQQKQQELEQQKQQELEQIREAEERAHAKEVADAQFFKKQEQLRVTQAQSYPQSFPQMTQSISYGPQLTLPGSPLEPQNLAKQPGTNSSTAIIAVGAVACIALAAAAGSYYLRERHKSAEAQRMADTIKQQLTWEDLAERKEAERKKSQLDAEAILIQERNQQREEEEKRHREAQARHAAHLLAAKSNMDWTPETRSGAETEASEQAETEARSRAATEARSRAATEARSQAEPQRLLPPMLNPGGSKKKPRRKRTRRNRTKRNRRYK